MCRSTSRAEMLAQEADELRRDFPQLDGAAGRGRFHQAVRAAGGDRRACRASDSSRARPSAISSRTRRRRSCATPRQILGRGAMLIIGVDLVKDPAVLNAAYNDARRRHREVQSQSAGAHQSRARRQFRSRRRSATTPSTTPSVTASRCISPARSARRCRVAGRMIEFRAGETIHTENSYKYTLEVLRRAGARRGLDAGGGLDRRQRIISPCRRFVAQDE